MSQQSLFIAMICRLNWPIRFVVGFLILLAVGGTSDVYAEKTRPNVLLIMADDLGFSDLGCYGGEIQTPHLDALAAGGLRYTQFYNTGRCWPTRGSLLSGYYAQQIRRDFLPALPASGTRGQRPLWAVLLPEMLAGVGYRSYHTGKWHIDGQPTKSGFLTSRVTDVGRYFKPLGNRNAKGNKKLAFDDKFYLTSAMADDAISNLKRHSEEAPGTPFFQYLAFTAPHFPLHATPEDIAIYDDVYQVGWDVIRSQRFKRQRGLGLLNDSAVGRPSAPERELGPPYHFPDAFEILGEGEVNKVIPWAKLTAKQQEFQAKKMAIHAAMIHRMDIAIGRVIQQIRRMGQWENTLVMFLSDNGASAEIMVRGDGHDPMASPGSALTYLCLGPGWSTTCNTPFRRHKTWTHEGGISTPFIVSWPKGIHDRGAIRREPHHVIDVAATLLELTQADHSSSAPPLPGKSFVDSFSGTEKSVQRNLWWYHDGHRAIRIGDLKAVAPQGEPWELYDLANDRIESVDLAIPRADDLAELVQEWERQLNEYTRNASDGIEDQLIPEDQQVNHRSGKMWDAQQAARIKRSQVLPQGKTLRINDRHAFLLTPDQSRKTELGMPWIFYGPALSRYPDQNEKWMHQQFLDAGVAVAGIDVGEAYGSPHSQPHFDALYDYMISNGYSSKPALLGRSRGGLYVTRFAIERPDRVAGMAGIYPVLDYTSYPGVQRASSVYGVSAEEMLEQQQKLNPVKRVAEIAAADIPVFIIHGTEDKVVPIEKNSAVLEAVYRDAGKSDLIQLERIDGQGHNFWEGFFRSQRLVDFLIETACNTND